MTPAMSLIHLLRNLAYHSGHIHSLWKLDTKLSRFFSLCNFLSGRSSIVRITITLQNAETETKIAKGTQRGINVEKGSFWFIRAITIACFLWLYLKPNQPGSVIIIKQYYVRCQGNVNIFLLSRTATTNAEVAILIKLNTNITSSQNCLREVS